jgi:hypothetical protein
MNTLLEKYFDIYNFSPKDRYEINQIFSLLPSDKQRYLLNNFDILSIKLERIHKLISLERRILIWDVFGDIRGFYDKYQHEL